MLPYILLKFIVLQIGFHLKYYNVTKYCAVLPNSRMYDYLLKYEYFHVNLKPTGHMSKTFKKFIFFKGLKASNDLLQSLQAVASLHIFNTIY